MERDLLKKLAKIQSKNNFSGTVLVRNDKEVLTNVSYGYANRSDHVSNNVATRYGIASGCKLFTAIAICQLVETKQLAFDLTLRKCLDADLPNFDKDITIHHLLTHTSGIPDYFDEEVMDDFEELWIKTPMYHLRELKAFLPLFQHQPMKLMLGERFSYNNAGYILLGLIVEQVSGQSFTDYIQEHIFKKAGMSESGYFELDALPSNTAQGYIDYPDGTWKTNIYSLPVKGGADGGAFVTVTDMSKLWDALINGQLLSEACTQKLLTPHTSTGEADNFYGYGVWIKKINDDILKYHVMGYDPGVSFHSAFYPHTSTSSVVCSNKSDGAYDMMKGIEEVCSNV
ncbi:beta-lactamase family protein [Salipaludibacillus sp. LMS25]|uniref:serine hydrolase domain-containing protein n=1 Tax=Salipaludibacillus sp. LMS25 TaxID=2924031 RepID=UPI0020D14340|nr:serine hydrolase [Salipaludibacillus sp. LMS25]UTR14021.1 beta-lactamase family protein [Salipaludibacillus sp. LMS25]